MKLVFFGSIALCTATAALAAPCDQENMANRAALAIEALHGGRPLRHETFSLDSRPDTWAVVLSYSGVQKTFLITLAPLTCEVLRLERR